jgi:hypothetical protein
LLIKLTCDEDSNLLELPKWVDDDWRNVEHLHVIVQIPSLAKALENVENFLLAPIWLRKNIFRHNLGQNLG